MSTSCEQIDFYILDAPSISARDYFACRLVQKAYHQKLPVYIKVSNDDKALTFDQMLWTFSTTAFIPHGLYLGEAIDDNQFPVQIGTLWPPERSDKLLIQLDDASVFDKVISYRRVAEIIINNSEEKSSGRQRYKLYQQAQIPIKTHQITR